MKRWVSRRNEQQPTLHQSVVWICAGCLRMAKKPYLTSLANTALFKRVRQNQCSEVHKLFVALSLRVTRKAMEQMFNDYNKK